MNLPLRHTIRHRVGYSETDQMGVVHHAVYLVWFERARIELLRAAGASYRELEARGVGLPVRQAHLRYLRPARFDDELEIEATLAELGRASCRFAYSVRRILDGERLAQGETELAFCDAQGRVVRHGPETLRALMDSSQHLSGQSSVQRGVPE